MVERHVRLRRMTEMTCRKEGGKEGDEEDKK